MTKLRYNMIKLMVLRKFSKKTIEAYVWAVKGLAEYFHTTPDQLTDKQVQDYLFAMLRERNWSWNTLHLAVYGHPQPEKAKKVTHHLESRGNQRLDCSGSESSNPDHDHRRLPSRITVGGLVAFQGRRYRFPSHGDLENFREPRGLMGVLVSPAMGPVIVNTEKGC